MGRSEGPHQCQMPPPLARVSMRGFKCVFKCFFFVCVFHFSKYLWFFVFFNFRKNVWFFLLFLCCFSSRIPEPPKTLLHATRRCTSHICNVWRDSVRPFESPPCLWSSRFVFPLLPPSMSPLSGRTVNSEWWWWWLSRR